MKKIISSIIMVALIFTFTNNIYAMELGELISVYDKVIPNGENATITQTIEAKTSGEGEVAFPVYKDSEIATVEVVNGTMIKEPELVNVGDKKYYIITFGEKEQEVKFVITLNQEGTYEIEEADLGDTYPANAEEIAYKVMNSSPLDIGTYSAQLAVPKGKELLNIVKYSAKKPYSIVKEDGYLFGQYNFKGVDAGEEIELAINVYTTSKASGVFIWIAGIIISIIFMMKNRCLLQKAKEQKLKKKEKAKA